MCVFFLNSANVQGQSSSICINTRMKIKLFWLWIWAVSFQPLCKTFVLLTKEQKKSGIKTLFLQACISPVGLQPNLSIPSLMQNDTNNCVHVIHSFVTEFYHCKHIAVFYLSCLAVVPLYDQQRRVYYFILLLRVTLYKSKHFTSLKFTYIENEM